ncbi:MAG TPA: hypothetical protein VGA40_07075 [Candidatus Acidoferrales bacterium]
MTRPADSPPVRVAAIRVVLVCAAPECGRHFLPGQLAAHLRTGLGAEVGADAAADPRTARRDMSARCPCGADAFHVVLEPLTPG